MAGNAPSQLFREHGRLLHVRFRQYDHHFFAAVAAADVGSARIFDQEPGELPQHGVAGLVSVCVIKLLEMVDVEHHQREAPSVSLCLIQLLLHAQLEIASHEEFRKAVGHCHCIQFRVIDRKRDLSAELVKEGPIFRIERLAVHRILKYQHPHRRVLRHQRYIRLTPPTGIHQRHHPSGQHFIEGAAMIRYGFLVKPVLCDEVRPILGNDWP